MRKLTKDEQLIIKTLQRRNKLNSEIDAESAKVEFIQKFPFTVAKIRTSSGTYVGFSKYNYNDKKLGLKFSEEVGFRLAFVKALTK